MCAVFELLTGVVSTRTRIERVLQRSAVALNAPPRLLNLSAQGVSAAADDSDARANEHILLVNRRWLATACIERVRNLSLAAALAQGDGR